jgi:hypothetical protein
MKITQLIERLQEIKTYHGDVFVNALTNHPDISDREAFEVKEVIVDDNDAFMMIERFPSPDIRPVMDYLNTHQVTGFDGDGPATEDDARQYIEAGGTIKRTVAQTVRPPDRNPTTLYRRFTVTEEIRKLIVDEVHQYLRQPSFVDGVVECVGERYPGMFPTNDPKVAKVVEAERDRLLNPHPPVGGTAGRSPSRPFTPNMVSDMDGTTESNKPFPAGTPVEYDGHLPGGVVAVVLTDGSREVVHPHCFKQLWDQEEKKPSKKKTHKSCCIWFSVMRQSWILDIDEPGDDRYLSEKEAITAAKKKGCTHRYNQDEKEEPLT